MVSWSVHIQRARAGAGAGATEVSLSAAFVRNVVRLSSKATHLKEEKCTTGEVSAQSSSVDCRLKRFAIFDLYSTEIASYKLNFICYAQKPRPTFRRLHHLLKGKTEIGICIKEK